MGARPRRRRGRPGPTVVAAGMGLASVVGSYLAIRSHMVVPWDVAARRALADAHNRPADRVVAITTDLGSVYGLAGVAGVLAASGRRTAGLDVAASGVIAWTAAQAVKPALRRPRPYESEDTPRLVAIPAGSSWPSGHAAVAAAMATALAPQLSSSGRAVVRAGTLAIGVSRLYVGVHHLSDVVAGVGVGVLSAIGWQAARANASGRSKAPRSRTRR